MAEPGFKNNIITTYAPDLPATTWISRWMLSRKNMPKVLKSLNNNPSIVNNLLDDMAKYKIIPFTSEYHDGQTNGITDHEKFGIAYHGKLPLNVRVHERTHALSKDLPLLQYIENLKKNKQYRNQNWLKDTFLSIWYGNNEEWHSYLDLPTEIYSRLMEVRHLNNLDPKKVWTLDDIKNLRKKVKDKEIFSEYTDDFILKLFNEVAQNNLLLNDLLLYAKNGTKMNIIERFKQGRKTRYINSNSSEAYTNRRRLRILKAQRYNVNIDGNWGPWQSQLWDLYTKAHPEINRRVDISKVSAKENRDRFVPVEALELFLDSLISRQYPYSQRLAILATSLQEVGKEGAASKGVGGNGYLGLSKERMPVELLNDTPEGRGKLIKYVLDNLETVVGAPNNNWTAGNSQSPRIESALDGFDKFWSANNPYDATMYLNKSYIRPAGNLDAWRNRANIANILTKK